MNLILLVVVVPVLAFVLWLREKQAGLNRDVWRRVFKSWRRALRDRRADH